MVGSISSWLWHVATVDAHEYRLLILMSASVMNEPRRRVHVTARIPSGNRPNATAFLPSDGVQVACLLMFGPRAARPSYACFADTLSARPQSLNACVMLLNDLMSAASAAARVML